MVDAALAATFLAGHRIALVGASADSRNFAHAVDRGLRDHGIEVIPVNPSVDAIDGRRCHPDLASVPDELDGVMVMVRPDRAVDVVRQCVERGVRRIWLFKGLGGPGAVSDEAVEMCHLHGIEVVDGACPFMFLEPVRGFHRFHRTVRRLNGSLAEAR